MGSDRIGSDGNNDIISSDAVSMPQRTRIQQMHVEDTNKLTFVTEL
jgi:hypothetical protein